MQNHTTRQTIENNNTKTPAISNRKKVFQKCIVASRTLPSNRNAVMQYKLADLLLNHCILHAFEADGTLLSNDRRTHSLEAPPDCKHIVFYNEQIATYENTRVFQIAELESQRFEIAGF